MDQGMSTKGVGRSNLSRQSQRLESQSSTAYPACADRVDLSEMNHQAAMGCASSFAGVTEKPTNSVISLVIQGVAYHHRADDRRGRRTHPGFLKTQRRGWILRA